MAAGLNQAIGNRSKHPNIIIRPSCAALHMEAKPPHLLFTDAQLCISNAKACMLLIRCKAWSFGRWCGECHEDFLTCVCNKWDVVMQSIKAHVAWSSMYWGFSREAQKNRPIIWHFLIQYVQAASSVIDSPTCSSPVVSTPGGFTGILLMGYHHPNKWQWGCNPIPYSYQTAPLYIIVWLQK